MRHILWRTQHNSKLSRATTKEKENLGKKKKGGIDII